MKKCPYCQAENEDGNEVCVHCKAGFPHEENDKTESVRTRKKTRSE